MSSTATPNTTESIFNGSYTDDTSQPAIHSSHHLFIMAMYSVIMFVSLVGNALVIAVVYRNKNKRMRTNSNYFIVNMSCSDLLITICNIPLDIAYLTKEYFVPVGGILGNMFCKLTTFVFYLSIYVSLLSLVVITVDRFLLVFYPLKMFITAKRARIIIGTIWLMGTIFTAPLAAQATLLEYGDSKACFFSLPIDVIHTYFITCLVVFVVLPLTTMVVLYSSIVVKLFRQKTPGANSAVNQEHSKKRNRKVLLMLVTVATLTIVCWLPYWSAYLDCILKLSTSSCNSLLHLQVITFANCALNPCAYVIFNENYRFGFYQILLAVLCPSWVRGKCCEHQVSPNESVSSRINSLALRSQRPAFSLESV